MKNNKITLRELYLGYEHKTYDPNSNTVPVPYFPKHEISDHRYALTFKEWKLIVLCYIKHMIKYLITGKVYTIPERLGEFQLYKWKSKKPGIDWGATDKKAPRSDEPRELVYYMNHHSKGYRPLFIWNKKESGRLPFKWHWRFKLSKGNWLNISKMLKEDITIINKLHQK